MPTWTQSLAIGVTAIDEEHKRLFDRADALLAGMKQHKPAEEVSRLIQFLDAYCSSHFRREEDLMRGRKFPGLHEHMRQHVVFTEQFQKIVGQFREKGPSLGVTVALQDLVCGWLLQHVFRVCSARSAWPVAVDGGG